MLKYKQEIKRHPWFANVPWGSIITREHPGPLASLKSFKLHTGSPPSTTTTFNNNTNNNYTPNDFHGDINLREEMAKARPSSEMSKSGSFDGFEGFRAKR